MKAQTDPTPWYVKSVQLRPLQENNFSNIVPLGTVLELSFDDVSGESPDYYYKVEHMTHDWKSSNLLANQYLNGFQQNPIRNVQNSFNTLQNYIHYSVQFPNTNLRITKSGNYLLSVVDEYDEVVFTRRFTLYESASVMGVTVSRSRNTQFMNEQQTVQFRVNHPDLQINNPSQEIHVAILQNNTWETAIANLQPTFFRPDQLVYSYTNRTNFWGGNEFLFFDTKTIRNKSLHIAKIEKKTIYHEYLYPLEYKEYKTYTYNPDINGQFVIRTLEGENPQTEADYAMMYFSLQKETPFKNKEVYVYGAFNNFELTPENKMIYNEEGGFYAAKILLKQGFYNYTFVTRNNKNEIERGSVLGNFSQTENEYTVLVYYKPFGSLYDRVIGVGTTIFEGER